MGPKRVRCYPVSELDNILIQGINSRPNLPSIFGYSKASSIPFIVLGLCTRSFYNLRLHHSSRTILASALPFRRYLSLLAADRGEDAVADVVRFVSDHSSRNQLSHHRRRPVDEENEGSYRLSIQKAGPELQRFQTALAFIASNNRSSWAAIETAIKVRVASKS